MINEGKKFFSFMKFSAFIDILLASPFTLGFQVKQSSGVKKRRIKISDLSNFDVYF